MKISIANLDSIYGAVDVLLKSKGSPYSITERWLGNRVWATGADLCSWQSTCRAGDVSLKPGGRLPLLSARPAVTLATLKRAATNFAAW